jgi:hypothetical protein
VPSDSVFGPRLGGRQVLSVIVMSLTSSAMAQVCSIPFGTATLAPITETEIWKSETCADVPDELADSMIAVVGRTLRPNARASFDGLRVRAGIRSKKESYLIDDDYVVLDTATGRVRGTISADCRPAVADHFARLKRRR